MQKNRGFTLIEALVTFAMLGVVAASLLGLTTAGTNSYKMISSDVSIQYEAQLVMGQLEEYLVDCNAGMCWSDDDIFRVASREIEEDGYSYIIRFFKWDESESELWYAEKPVTFSGENAVCSEADLSWALMGKNISHFKVEASGAYAKVELGMTKQNRSYRTDSTFAMRNRVETGTQYDIWLQRACKKEA